MNYGCTAPLVWFPVPISELHNLPVPIQTVRNYINCAVRKRNATIPMKTLPLPPVSGCQATQRSKVRAFLLLTEDQLAASLSLSLSCADRAALVPSCRIRTRRPRRAAMTSQLPLNPGDGSKKKRHVTQRTHAHLPVAMPTGAST